METEQAGGGTVRPTKAVVVKALRDMVRPVVEGLTVLDLFAGTGRVHKALLEEGASQAYAVGLREEPDELENRIWFRQSVDEFLSLGPPRDVGFVFMDPPYGSGYLPGLLTRVIEKPWVQTDALVAVESSALTPVELPKRLSEGFVRLRDRAYGKSRLSVYQGDREEEVQIETFNQ